MSIYDELNAARRKVDLLDLQWLEGEETLKHYESILNEWEQRDNSNASLGQLWLLLDHLRKRIDFVRWSVADSNNNTTLARLKQIAGSLGRLATDDLYQAIDDLKELLDDQRSKQSHELLEHFIRLELQRAADLWSLGIQVSAWKENEFDVWQECRCNDWWDYAKRLEQISDKRKTLDEFQRTAEKHGADQFPNLARTVKQYRMLEEFYQKLANKNSVVEPLARIHKDTQRLTEKLARLEANNTTIVEEYRAMLNNAEHQQKRLDEWLVEFEEHTIVYSEYDEFIKGFVHETSKDICRLTERCRFLADDADTDFLEKGKQESAAEVVQQKQQAIEQMLGQNMELLKKSDAMLKDMATKLEKVEKDQKKTADELDRLMASWKPEREPEDIPQLLQQLSNELHSMDQTMSPREKRDFTRALVEKMIGVIRLRMQELQAVVSLLNCVLTQSNRPS